jgi:hypothetical protein
MEKGVPRAALCPDSARRAAGIGRPVLPPRAPACEAMMEEVQQRASSRP